jgi:hypothetical protein
MAEPAFIQPNEVPIIGPDGAMVAVPRGSEAEAIRLGGRIASDKDIQEFRFGGAGGQAKAALLGAAETATMGGSTALLAEGGVLTGGQEGRRSVEEEIRNIEKTNPIAHTLGGVAPMLLAPEAGGEELAAGLVKGSGIGARALRFAAPEFARGVAETAVLEGAQGINEDILDHDLAAESFYVHALKPEVLYGGLLNVGVSAGFKGFGKLTSAMGKSIGGRAGEIAANDAVAFEDVVRSVQAGGGTSQDANAAIRDMQRMANERAVLPAEQKGLLDPAVDRMIAMHSRGDADTARRLTRIYRDGSRTMERLDNDLVAHAKDFDRLSTEVVNDLGTMERARSGLKQANVQRLADPSRMDAAADAANGWFQEIRTTLFPHAEPPPPRAIEAYERDVLNEWKRQGTKVPQDPAAAEAHKVRARSWAEAARESDVAAWETEIQRLASERAAKMDPEIIGIAGYDPAMRVGMARRDMGQLESLLLRGEREVRAAIKQGGKEGVARIFTAIDDTRQIFGHMASFGKEGTVSGSVAKRLEQHLYENRLRPMLEDSNVWGSELADLQSINNKAVSDSIKATNDFKRFFFTSLEHDAGAPIFRSKEGPTKSFIERLGEYGNASQEEMIQKVIDSARARGSAMLKTMDLPGPVRAAIERAGKNATDLEKVLGSARTLADDTRQIRAMKAREGESAGHGIVGKLLDFATSPARSMQMLGNFRKAETEVRSFLTKESSGFLKGEKVPNVKPMLGEAEKKAAIKSIEDLKKYQTDPRALALEIKTMLGDMTDSSPQMASAVATTIARGVLALAKRAPVPLPPRLADKPGEVRYANGEIERYWRNKQLVEQPKVVMQLMRSGQLHQEDLELAQEVIPRLVEQMRMQLEKDMLVAKQKGGLRTMSYQEQLSLSWMLGRPLDASQSASFVSSMQQSAAQDPMNQAAFGRAAMGGGRPSNLEKINLERYSTLQEKLEE